MKKVGEMYWTFDLEQEIMEYCLKKKGKWWATRWFRNKEVDDLYSEIRKLPVDNVHKYILGYKLKEGSDESNILGG